MPLLTRILITLALGLLMTTTSAYAADRSTTITVGTQEVGLTAGYMLPHRLTQDHTTKQQGPAFMPSWMMTVTDLWATVGIADRSQSAPRWSISNFRNRFSLTASASPRKSDIRSADGIGSGPMPNSPEVPFGPISQERSQKSRANSISS